jgi:HK97 gp10 family phage protein
VNVTVRGTEALIAKMRQLPNEVEFKIMANAVVAAANVFQKEARALVPKRTGTLARAIRVVKTSSKTQVGAKVVLKGKHAFLGKWMEWGTAAHLITAKRKISLYIGGKPVGRQVTHPGIRPQPFMRPATDNKMGEATATVRDFLERHVRWGEITAPTIKADEG